MRPFRLRPASSLNESHRRHLDLAAGSYARILAAELTSLTRMESGVEIEAIDQWSWGDILAGHPEPACLGPMAVPPLLGAGVVTCSLPLAMTLVDRLLGGPGSGAMPERSLTDVETTLMRDVHQRAIDALGVAMAIVVPLQAVVERQLSRLQLIKASPPDSVLIMITAAVKVGAVSGQLRIGLPAEGLLAGLDEFGGGGATAASIADLSEPLLETPVRVHVEFNTSTLTPTEIVDLEVGDVIPLPHAVNEPLTLFVEGHPYLHAVAGRRGVRLACAIVEPSTGAHA